MWPNLLLHFSVSRGMDSCAWWDCITEKKGVTREMVLDIVLRFWCGNLCGLRETQLPENIIPQIQIVQSKNSICTTWRCDFLRYFTQIHFAFGLLFVISYRRFIDLTKDFQDVCYLQWSKGYMLKYCKEKTSKPRYT